MIQAFKKNGYHIVNFNMCADIYIINTCTVTNMSDRKSRQLLRRCKELNKDSIIIAVGCYAEVAKEEIENMKKDNEIQLKNEEDNMKKLYDKQLELKERGYFQLAIRYKW